MNPFTDVNFGPAPCLPCCETPGIVCECALQTPGPPGAASPFASYADAAADIAAQSADCYVWSTGGTPTGLHADVSVPNQITATATTSGGAFLVVNLSMLAGSTLTISSSTSGSDPGIVIVLDCFGNNLTGTQFPFGTYTFPVPADGAYYLYALPLFVFPTSITYSCDNTAIPNPVIANWDDSGTTRSLWACPKLLLPPLTESTGDWFLDCATAGTTLTDPILVSNCVGFYDTSTGPLDTLTATDGGTSLSFAGAWTGLRGSFGGGWGGINAVSGATLSFAWTDFSNASVGIYDDTGVIVETLTGGSSPLVSSALPYTGRYTVAVTLFSPPPFGVPQTSGSWTVTSSGTLSVNPVQARYDLGLSCAGTLNCGDACP